MPIDQFSGLLVGSTTVKQRMAQSAKLHMLDRVERNSMQHGIVTAPDVAWLHFGMCCMHSCQGAAWHCNHPSASDDHVCKLQVQMVEDVGGDGTKDGGADAMG